MQIINLDRKFVNYLDSLNIDPTQNEEKLTAIIALLDANIKFKVKLEKFKQFIDCLSADRCFDLWIRKTEEILLQSENTLIIYSYEELSEPLLAEKHKKLAEKIHELAKCHIYQGHWEFGLSEEADQQFDDLTELYRRIWMKEGKAWLNLARAWNSLKPTSTVF